MSDTNATTFGKVMNPESAVINGVLGKNENGEEKFKSHLNPLFDYTNDDSVGTLEKWSDPLMTTLDANCEKKHWGYLNPVHNAFSSKEEGENAVPPGQAFMDPGLACATSFIEDKNVATGVRAVLNPVGFAVGSLIDGIIGIFK